MSLEKVRVVVVLPAGPDDHEADTVGSLLHYLGPSRAIVVVDDTGDPSGRDQMQELGPEVR